MGIEIATLAVAIVAALSALGCVVVVARFLRAGERREAERAADLARLREANDALQQALGTVSAGVQALTAQAGASVLVERQHHEGVARAVDSLSMRVDATRRETTQQLERTREAMDGRLGGMAEAIDRQLGALRLENDGKLEAIRQTVDEKLASTLNDRLGASFKQVSDQLEAVYRGLGDMQSVAAGVGDLKRVLSGVKTRGILGEVQLGAILADLLAPDQYAENVATKPGSTERVEFAVKVPVRGGAPIWLPIDAKFPGTTYEHLRDAIDGGDAAAVAEARRALDQVIKREARDICEKYISVPETTNFAVMFLPFEGLYAEIADRPGLIECLQRDYRVNVAGPSTMAVILNSLQMSYQTFAFQRRADEIQQVLSAVKAEFPKYQAELRRALRQIETAGKTVDGIINTRTNVIERKLKSVTALKDDALAAELLELGDVALPVGADVDGAGEPLLPGAFDDGPSDAV